MMNNQTETENNQNLSNQTSISMHPEVISQNIDETTNFNLWDWKDERELEIVCQNHEGFASNLQKKIQIWINQSLSKEQYESRTNKIKDLLNQSIQTLKSNKNNTFAFYAVVLGRIEAKILSHQKSHMRQGFNSKIASKQISNMSFKNTMVTHSKQRNQLPSSSPYSQVSLMSHPKKESSSYSSFGQLSGKSSQKSSQSNKKVNSSLSANLPQKSQSTAQYQHSSFSHFMSYLGFRESKIQPKDLMKPAPFTQPSSSLESTVSDSSYGQRTNSNHFVKIEQEEEDPLLQEKEKDD